MTLKVAGQADKRSRTGLASEALKRGLEWAGRFDALRRAEKHAQSVGRDLHPFDAEELSRAEKAIRRAKPCKALDMGVADLVRASETLYELRARARTPSDGDADRIANLEKVIAAAGRELERSLKAGRRKAARNHLRDKALAYALPIVEAMRVRLETRFELGRDPPQKWASLHRLFASIAHSAAKAAVASGTTAARAAAKAAKVAGVSQAAIARAADEAAAAARMREPIWLAMVRLDGASSKGRWDYRPPRYGFYVSQLNEILAELLCADLLTRPPGSTLGRRPWRQFARAAVGRLEGRRWEQDGPFVRGEGTPLNLARDRPVRDETIKRALSRAR